MRPTSLVLLNIGFRVLVDRLGPCPMRCLERCERDCEIMPELKASLAAEVGQTFPLFLAHVFAVRLIGRSDSLEPGLAADLLLRYGRYPVSDFVVILDGILGLLLSALLGS